jgi:type II secretory pathway component PulC
MVKAAFEPAINLPVAPKRVPPDDGVQAGSGVSDARIVPNFIDRKLKALRSFSIRAGSDFDRIGIKNGDTVLPIAGESINTIEEAKDIFARLRNSVTLKLERGGITRDVVWRE